MHLPTKSQQIVREERLSQPSLAALLVPVLQFATAIIATFTLVDQDKVIHTILNTISVVALIHTQASFGTNCRLIDRERGDPVNTIAVFLSSPIINVFFIS